MVWDWFDGDDVDFGWEVCLIFFDKCFFCYGLDDEICEVDLWLDLVELFFLDCDGYLVVRFGDLEGSEVWLWISLMDDNEWMLLLDLIKSFMEWEWKVI